jgi:two-component system, sensor histidine kinase
MLRSQKIVLFLFAVLALAVVAAAYRYIEGQQRHAVDLAAANLVSTGDTLVREAGKLTQSLDLVAEVLRNSLKTDTPTLDALIERMGTFLVTSAGRVAETGGLVIVDAQGLVRFATVPLPKSPVSVADREYFNVARDHPTSPGFLGRPIFNRISGGRVFPLIWPLSDQNNAYAGLVIANLSSRYLERLVASADTDLTQGIAAIVHPDGTVMAINAPYRLDLPKPTMSQSEPLLTIALASDITPEEKFSRWRGKGSVAGQSGDWLFYSWAGSQPMAGVQKIGVVVGVRLDKLADYTQTTLLPVYISAALLLLLLAVAAILLFNQLAAQQRAVQAAQAGDQAKSDFLAMISHEIRTPMTAVIGMNQLLGRTTLDRRQRSYVQAVGSAGETMLALLNDLLDLAKLDARKLRLDSAAFDPSRLLSELAVLYGPQARDKGLMLIWDAPASPPPALLGDARRLRQVVSNLLGNAIKFTPSGSINLVLSVEPSDGALMKLRIEVCDTGVGIRPDDVDTLFMPFSQAGNHTQFQQPGTGLGLAVSKRLVTLMGGDIGVNSIPGSGSVFWLELVLPQSPVAAVEAPAPSNDAGAILAGCRVLVAEDVPLNRQLLEDGLRTMGAHVTAVANGRDVVDRLARAPYDIALLDLHMPEMGGLDATRYIRAQPMPLSALPVIILTAGTPEDLFSQCRAAGANTVLGKPIDWRHLSNTIHSLWKPVALSSAHVATSTAEDALRTEAALEAALMLTALRDSADAQARRIQAHALHGMAANFGFAALAQAAAAIESAPDADDLSERLLNLEKALNATFRTL